MIKQLTFTVILLLWYVFSSYGLVVPSIFISKEKEITRLLKKIFSSVVYLNIKYGFDANIYYHNLIKCQPNKVNILLANHLSTIDWEILLAIIKESNINNFLFVGKKQLMYVPGFGFSFFCGSDIKLSRKWENDQISLNKQIDNLEEGLLVIFPEGTRFDPNKHIDAVQFSKDNSLPIYNNLLVPKSKGLWTICNKLIQRNKLGFINDTTIVIENFKNRNAYFSDLIKNPLGNIYIQNRQLYFDNKETSYEDFKKWLLNIWVDKDLIIDNYKNINYQKSLFNIDYQDLLLFIFIFLFGFTQKYSRYYLLVSIIISYLFIFIKKKKLHL